MKEVNTITISRDSGEEKTLNYLDFVVFIDETGHELLKDSKYPIFGLGGCAVMVQNYNSFIDLPWINIKREYFKDENIQLHASESNLYTKEQINAIGEFFINNHFSRVASTVSDKSILRDKITCFEGVSSDLIHRIEEIASIWNLEKLVLIFEDTERGNSLLNQHFLKCSEATVKNQENTKKISIEKYIMPKSSSSGLEVADFVMHAAGGQVLSELSNPKKKVRKDFKCTFLDVDKKYASFHKIIEAVRI